jgi:hypothetical protein
MEKLYVNNALKNNLSMPNTNIFILQEQSNWDIKSFHDQMEDWLRCKINYYSAILYQKFSINVILICNSNNIISKFYLIQSINPNVEQFENILHLCLYESLNNIISKKKYCLCFNLDFELFELFERLYLVNQPIYQPMSKSDTNYSNEKYTRKIRRITYRYI